jgi:hypothetical protein
VLGEFDVAAYEALDKQRVARGLSWQGVAREIRDDFLGGEATHPVSASTLTGMRSRGSMRATLCCWSSAGWVGRRRALYPANQR